ncbi:MAG: hypothetical protein CVV23_00640 [Ignavibacteriae bacterium HGW-Ignavibacteriae-2]|jgi:outer membrane protein TolC|nr:MAG: hypothetical protein CVV23_00640 [Ignavibacteriae bacterium HGW-Ignavibacteriae-2]
MNRNITLILFFILGQVIFAQHKRTNYTSAKKITLKECLQIVVANNTILKAADADIDIARAQLGQAKSGLYPRLTLESKLIATDEPPNFIFPAFKMDVGKFNLGTIAFDVPPIDVPEQNIKLADQLSAFSNINLIYPLFTGGKISSLIDQATSNIHLTQNEAEDKKNKLLVNVATLYSALILSKTIYNLADDFDERMQVTLNLTKEMYETGSGSVTKLDYLKNKLLVESIRGIKFELQNKFSETEITLKYLLDIDNNTELVPADDSLSIELNNYDAENLMLIFNKQNPTNKKIFNAQSIFKSKLNEAQSGYLPSVGLFGGYQRIDNSYKYGMVTKENKNSFMVGIGLQFPIFEGFYTDAKVEEIEAGIRKLEFEKELFNKTSLFLINRLLNDLSNSYSIIESSKEAMFTAEENLALTKRAYQNDLADVSEFIQSQMFSTITKIIYNIRKFEYLTKNYQLKLVTGESLL